MKKFIHPDKIDIDHTFECLNCKKNFGINCGGEIVEVKCWRCGSRRCLPVEENKK